MSLVLRGSVCHIDMDWNGQGLWADQYHAEFIARQALRHLLYHKSTDELRYRMGTELIALFRSLYETDDLWFSYAKNCWVINSGPWDGNP